ncbi:MAG: hypothetical protein EAZ13_10590 [Sphingobacteriia bacterium]|nr:MAG: hypothetical protein EAZ13_10590 [Sphingobacteriia bacterium]
MSNASVRNKLYRKINSLSFDKEDLHKLLLILQDRAITASEIEYKKLESQNAENLDRIKENLEVCAVLKITLTGSNNYELFGTIEEVFNSISFPETVKTLYVNSELIYHSSYNYYPENSFQLLLDFSKPKIFDFSFQPSDKTPNETYFTVQGSDNTWVNGVFHEINAFIDENPSKFHRVHKGSVYDLLVWIFGIPFGFWICQKFLNQDFSIFKTHSFYQNLCLTYFFFLSLFILRVLFHYFRWIYPMIEFRSKKNKSILHQVAIVGISLGILTNMLYDIFRHFLKT